MSNENLSLGEAVNRFLASLPPEVKGASQPEVYKFVRWFGKDHPLAGLTGAEVSNYAERLSTADADYLKKLGLLKAFLLFAKGKRWSSRNLASYLKAKKGKTGVETSPRHRSRESVFLTRQGYTEMTADLAALQGKRVEIIDEMRRAAADKDFRENAPLHAAREQRGHLEGRITELEETLKSAVIIDEKREDTPSVSLGDSVILYDLNSGKELSYTLVSPREVDLAQGKISSVSPTGQVLLGRSQGEVVEVAAPAGKRRYQIKQIEHG